MGLFGKVAPTAAPPPATTPPAATFEKCNFCGKSRQEVRKLVAGENAAICDECIGLSNDIVFEDQVAQEKSRLDALAWPDAATLVRRLDEAALGQRAAKRALAAALRQHLHAVKTGPGAPRPTRVLLVGPTGTGKTLLARAICEAAGLPAHHADVTRLSQTGYVGEDVENLAAALVTTANGDAAWAEHGLLVLDGLEKIRAGRRDASMPLDVAGDGAQRDLLRLLDGLPMELPASSSRRHPQAPSTPFSPARLLVIGVACVDATEASTDGELRASLRQLGLRAELVARFDRIVPVPALDEAALAAVAGHTAGPIAEARRLVQSFGAELEWTLEAIQVLARAAAAAGHGAWGLRWPVQRQLEEVFASDGPERTFRVDADVARTLVEGAGAARGPYR